MASKDPMIGSKLLSSLRVVDLKEELEKCGLSKSGTKKDLAERLRNYILQQEQIVAAKEVPPAAAADDELPNISMQEKLAEKNPFLRDYFASQAELFHSQKVAKKLLLEEEARRESEASAPSADEGGESSAAEDNKDLNSSTEEVPSGKVKELTKKFENNSTPVPLSLKKEIATPQPSTPVQPIKSTRQRQLEALAKKAELIKPPELQEAQPVVEIPQPKMVEKVIEDKFPEQDKEPSPASSRSSSRSASPEPQEKSSDSSESEDETPQNLTTNNSNGNVKKLTDHFEGKAEEIAINLSPVKTLNENETEVREEKAHSSLSRSSSKSRSPIPSGEPVEQHHDQPRESKEIENVEIKSTTGQVTNQGIVTITKNRDPEPDKIVSKLEEPKVDIALAKRTIRAPSARVEEMEEEEVLDYGEEEKVQTEPAKFDWTRRVLRVKNKHPVKTEKRKWKNEIEPKSIENINSDIMIQWFSEVHLAPAVEFKEEKRSSEGVHEDNDVHFSRTFSIESEEGGTGANVKVENITITRRISLVPMIQTQNDEEEDKDLPPARNPASELILVSNLTRPFTLPQLRELLQRTGNLEDLWVDKIKSRCIAKYEKQEDAFETRAALHGIKWPQSNPKALHVDYTTQEALIECKARDTGDIKPLMEKPVVADNLPVREWDMGKMTKSRSPKRKRTKSRSTSRDRKRGRRSASPNHRRHSRSPHQDRRSRGDAKEHEPLGKALDELFRKTTATPSIYWLPLTPAQIAEKEEMRRKRMIERERRLAEIGRIRPR